MDRYRALTPDVVRSNSVNGHYLYSPQLSWDAQSELTFGSDDSLSSENSSESLDDTIKEVTHDLHDMLKEVEDLKRASIIYDSTTELDTMIKDAGNLSKRNSLILSEDFDVFSNSKSEVQSRPKKKESYYRRGNFNHKRFSTHLTPSDALNTNNGRYPVLRHAKSVEILVTPDPDEKRKNRDSFLGNSTADIDEEIDNINPWDADEKEGGVTYTLKV